MKLDRLLEPDVRTAIYRTWDAIGSDLYQACEECGEELDNEGAVECVLDANRIEDYGGPNRMMVADLLREYYKEYGYGKVFNHLVKYIHLA